MGDSRNPSHVALYDSSYFILFRDGSWTSHGLSNTLIRKIKQSKSDIAFLTLGPYQQWFFRLDNGKVYYNVKDSELKDELQNSTVLPYKLWFNADDGYVLQYDDLSLSWYNIPNEFHNKLNGRQKSLPTVQNITFGGNGIWWVSFQDDTACWSSNLPSHINRQLLDTACLVLNPMDETNYFIFKENGLLKWQVNDHFDNDINESDEDDDNDVIYMDPQLIRYTQTSIGPQFSNGHTIEQLRQDLEHGTTTVDEVPMINAVRTRSGNIWSLNNRRLWCFRHGRNITRIPVHIVDERPSWFNKRIQQIEDSFDIRVRGSSEEADFDSDSDD